MADEKSDRNLWIWRGGIVAAIIVATLLLLRYCEPKSLSVATVHPADNSALLALGDAVVTGFSGVADPASSDARTSPSPDGMFINVNGASARIFNVARPGSVWAGQYWAAPHSRDIPASAIGQVFGVAIDDAVNPNIYLTATSLYGLNIVLPNKDTTLPPQRLKKGQAGAQWMAGQFGPGGNPGTIWKVDGRTGAIARFADVLLNGAPVGPASLGNMAYDNFHHQLFVSDLATGNIHRFDLTGRELSFFDHGVAGRSFAQLTTIPNGIGAGADIRSDDFRPSEPATWGVAPAARRVFGMAINAIDHRLYYAVSDGQIWSIGLTKDGDFSNDPRVEVDIPGGAHAAAVSDIVFTRDGLMIAAQRAVLGTGYDYTPLAASAVAHVWRFWPAKPFDPSQSRHFYPSPEEYAVGYAGDSRNSAGGVALGYGYKSDGTIDPTDCEDAIFFTGDVLRNFQQTQSGFAPDGRLQLYGLQISPRAPVRGFNVPPAVSYFVNYADTMGSANRSGSVGDVAVYRVDCTGPGCKTPAAPGPSAGLTPATPRVAVAGSANNNSPPGGTSGTSTPPSDGGTNGSDGGTHGGPGGCTPGSSGCGIPCPPNVPGCGPCITPDCCVGDGCLPHPGKVCMPIKDRAVCDPPSGSWMFQLTASDPHNIGITTLNVQSATSGVGITNGPNISLMPAPATVGLSGALPGQNVSLAVCGFNSADPNYLAGKPYDCCREILHLRVPRGVCKIGDTQPR